MVTTPTEIRPLDIIDWGRTEYATAQARQLAWVAEHIAGGRGDALIFTEHEPVFTVGLRSGAAQHLVWNEARLAAEGVTLETTNRGGDITYHGPGQIVGYPIVSLTIRRDLHAYLRFLEQVMIDSVAHFGVVAGRRDGLTGIWVEDRKIAAIGVAVRRWVTYHGFALNVSPNLAHFGGIVPCGIAATDGHVSSLAAELGDRCPSLAAVRAALATTFSAALPQFLAGAES